MSVLDNKLQILFLENELSELRIRNYILERDAESDITLAEENEEIIEGLCNMIDEKDEYIEILENGQEELFTELDEYDELLADIVVTMKEEYDIEIEIEFLDDDELDDELDEEECDCDGDCDNCESKIMFGVIH